MNGTLWLAWRQQRTLVLVAAGLAVLGTVIAYLAHRHLTSELAADWMRGCGWDSANGDACPFQRFSEFRETEVVRLRAFGFLIIALPGLVGLFWGAPLLGRDAELGTSKLVLTQDANRTRWFVSRFALAAVVTIALTTLLSLLWSWWREPLNDKVYGVQWYDAFALNATGPRAVAATLFGLALGTAAGLLLRRILPAMIVTLVGVCGVGAALELGRRALVPPRLYVSTGSGPKVPMGDKWSSGNWGYLTPSGKREGIENCTYTGEELRKCMASHNYVQRFYEANPHSDRWLFQAWETGIFLVLTIALILLTGWLLRRRRV
ncbi:transporter [Streptomyces iconiensis]|uniref:Transporter n=1 Tax=Streptomyces iconiensis TaxID=1384038 RepID=A0ABT7A509_9ACTN|nr:transporter [Streptomyces iconiensis]MDJ1136401.1 transporter [Streptomyces iconiensis]